MALGITDWQTTGGGIHILYSDSGIQLEGCIQQRFHRTKFWSLTIAEKNAQQEENVWSNS